VGDVDGEAVVDLYAGAGLFSVPLAEAVGPAGSVLAIERDGRACEDARRNGGQLRTLHLRQAEVSPQLVESAIGRPDVVVLDPAREGAGTDVMRALAGHAASLRVLVYVSCDPASFSRDLRVLLDEGWALTALRAFDLFPMTEHVELVAAVTPPPPPPP
jgi:tRNA/tmRNA/rRNA uracil-C5-methylase (TrmA/RlmC/RlmD family)